ncbi:hypothetical protein ACFX5Q_09195 [Mesorhizobium sp. IMUNJ 23033]|uniref:hypothetical protein n=1 Tax=Mesorhizobium sp. IMUNJ 23033 TaxID=3378039 RepID=UPI00384BECCE
MSKRMLAMLGIGLAATAGGAHASSILVLGASTSTPSVVKLGAAEPMKIASAPSVVALGEAVPDVTNEKVAAIPEKPHIQSPMIIRGGIVGGAFATPAAAPAKATAAAEPAAGDTKPAAGTKPAPDGKPAATASNGEQQPAPQPEPTAAQPSPIAPVGKAM